MNKRILWLAIAMLPLLGGTAAAEICTVDAVPASTLLIPYFEVDLASPAGVTTLFSVNSVASEPVVAQVTLWTDWSVPTLAFDIYLEALDVQSFNLRDVFAGRLPGSAPAPGDPQPPGCSFPLSALAQADIDRITQAHTGAPVTGFGGHCAGQDYGDGTARGYVTIDQVEACDPSLTPQDGPAYFGPDGIAGNENVLWGDVFYVDPGKDYAQGEMAVAIESAEPGFFGPSDYTFYKRYVSAAEDRREPLAPQFGTRFLTGIPFDRSEILCWRDPKAPALPQVCGSGPPLPMPLSQTLVVFFDEAGNIEQLPGPPAMSPQPAGTPGLVCPLATQRVEIPSANLPTIHRFGWILLDLRTRTVFSSDPLVQAWVGSALGAEGRYSVGFDVLQLCSTCDPTGCF